MKGYIEMNESNIASKKSTFLSVKNISIIAVMTAVTCILGPLSLPIGVVPISLTNFAIYISLYALGMKRGTISYLVYVLIGFVGVPVFSNFSGGAGKLLGPTGGYIFGFIFMAIISGFFIDKWCRNIPLCMLGMILGIMVTYLFGTVWLSYEANMTMKSALAAGVWPFIPGDLIKMLIAAIIGPKLRSQLKSANVLVD